MDQSDELERDLFRRPVSCYLQPTVGTIGGIREVAKRHTTSEERLPSHPVRLARLNNTCGTRKYTRRELKTAVTANHWLTTCFLVQLLVCQPSTRGGIMRSIDNT